MNRNSSYSPVMNVICRVHLTLVLLAIFDPQITGRLIIKPRDMDVKLNHSTYFNCSTNVGKTSIFWFHGKKYVYTGRAILEPYHERFKVDKSEWNGTYIYNLVIHSVQPGDAGEYRCEEDEGLGETYSVQLIVLDHDPICRSNMELDEVIGQNSCNIEPDEVELECSIRYHGNIPPQIEWTQAGKNSSKGSKVSIATYRNKFVSTLKLNGDIALNNSSYICGTKRTQEPNNCTSKVIKILYALSDNFTVNKTTDDEVHCFANTSQSCSYKWRWVQDDDVTVESSTAVLKPNKPGLHLCEALCYIRNKTCNLLLMRVMVSSQQLTIVSGEQKTDKIVVAIVVPIIIIVMIGVLIAVFVVLKKRKAQLTSEKRRLLDKKSSLNFDTEFFKKYTTPDNSLSEGYFGTVYGPIPCDGIQLTIKQVLLENDERTCDINNIKLKQFIWTSLKHEHLMKIYSVDLNQLPKAFYIVMEYAVGGSLMKTLGSFGSENKLPIDVVTDWAKQIAKGMLFLHDNNIVHGNLKPSNILLMELFDIRNPWKTVYLKIADFDHFTDRGHSKISSFVLNVSYMAPEVRGRNGLFSKASDVWSYGALIWEMLSGVIPYEGLQPSQIMGQSLLIAPSFPENYKLIIKKCWNSTCEDRISFQKILDILYPPENSFNFDTDFFKKYATSEHILSKGSYGTIYGPIQLDGIQLAIKQVVLTNYERTFRSEENIKEVQIILTSLKHEHLTRIHSVDLSQFPESFYIVMEYAVGGSLNETLRTLGSLNKLPIDVVTDWAIQIAEGMQYLHENCVFHRNLEPSNILLKERFDFQHPGNAVTLKIADFDIMSRTNYSVTKLFVGNVSYMAPEIIIDQRFYQESDVWSFGVLIWAILSGDIPHKGLQASEIIEKSRKGELDCPPILPSFQDNYKVILKKCWHSTHEERLSFEEILHLLDPTDSTVNFDTNFFNKHVIDRKSSTSVYGPIEWRCMQLTIKQIVFAADNVSKEIRNEIEARQQMWMLPAHEHITTIYSVDLSQLPKALNIVMEFAAGSTLDLASNTLPIDVVTDWAKQIAAGMLYLHKKNIVHRNLKSTTILLMEKFDVQNPSKSITLKITDVDEIRDFDEMVRYSFVGNFSYMAPEVLADQRFSKASDVWSFGVVIWKMLSGYIPYKLLRASDIIDKSRKRELDYPPILPSFPEKYQFILKKCWKSKCEERPSFEQIYDVLNPNQIGGLTILHQEVFVSRADQSVIEVYDSTTFSFKRRVTVGGMYDYASIASCSVNNCLYTDGSSDRILRIDPFNGNLIKAWKSAGGPRQHSVASDTNVISVSVDGCHFYEYTADGELIRTIDFPGGLCRTKYFEKAHAVKLENGLFIFCHPYNVYLLSTEEPSAERINKARLLRQFTAGFNIKLGGMPCLSVNKEGSILVSDRTDHQVVLLNSNFDEARIIISKEYGIESPTASFFNESSGAWLVTDSYKIFACRLKGETIERKIHYIFGY